MIQDKNSKRFLQERICSLKEQLQECKQTSIQRKIKNSRLISEIRKLRKLLFR